MTNAVQANKHDSDTLDMHSPNLVDDNVQKIMVLFPNCITESEDEHGNLKKAVDFDLLRQELSQSLVEGGQERYRLDWPGKRKAILEANSPIAKTLRPARDESVNFDTTENLFIEGDNLEALKLLQESYLGQVKMIYIDPPYNTGNDFIYEDDFSENTADFLERSEQVDEEGNRLITNLESNGRFHSDWLTMMYSRLKLARNLLREDGIILISIDDREQANTKSLLNQIFGSANTVGTFVVVRSEGGGLAKNLIKGHDLLFAYAKDITKFAPLLRPKDIRGKKEIIDGEEYWIEEDWLREEFGRYGTCDYNDIIKFFDEKKKQEIDAGIESGKYILIEKENKTIVGRYRKISEDGSKFYSVIKHLNKNGANDLKKLGLDKEFSYPKPVSLLKDMILGTTFFKQDKNALILDLFSGSGTTADAVMQLNAEDGGNRKFIMIQIEEPIDLDKQKDAYKFCLDNDFEPNIAEISKERIRRAGQKILADNQNKDGIENPDIGFRVLKIDSTNMKEVYYTPDEYSQAELDNLESHIKEDRTGEDLLFQVMLDWGVPLSLPIKVKQIQGSSVYYVGIDSLVACFDTLTTDLIDEISKDKPLKFVSSELAIAHDQDKTNIKARFAQLSPDTQVKFI